VFKRVLLCYDGSTAGRAALKQGADLAILVGAQVYVLSIIPTGVVDPVVVAAAAGHTCLVDDEGRVQQLLDESVEWLKVRGVTARGYLSRGITIDEIVTHAERLEVDLIVVAHYPRATGGRWWSGPGRASLAERVSCAVLITVPTGGTSTTSRHTIAGN